MVIYFNKGDQSYNNYISNVIDVIVNQHVSDSSKWLIVGLLHYLTPDITQIFPQHWVIALC